MWTELRKHWKSDVRPGWRFVFAGAGGAAFTIFAATLYGNGADGGDWLQFFGGALGAILAVFGAAYVADLSQAAALLRDRGSAISEVLRATDRAFEVYENAVKKFPFEGSESPTAAGICAEASQVRMTLDRLLSRPTLTDGAIEVGAGAIALMDTVISAGAMFLNNKNNGADASRRLMAGLTITDSIKKRRDKVRDYGERKGYIETAAVELPPVTR